MKDLTYWAAIAQITSLGGKNITRLLARFGSPAAIFDADAEDLVKVRGIGPKTAGLILSTDLNLVESKMMAYQHAGISLLTWNDPHYPKALLKTEEAPAVLFIRGNLEEQDQRALAIIGTRKPSRRSVEIAHQVSAILGRQGWTIVSGLAYGIDTAAHQGALSVASRTIAVLGSGLNRIYPKENETLAYRIENQGALLSEIPPDKGITPQSLAARNRITSGLSQAVIIIESEDDSGTLITASHAKRQGRPLFFISDMKNPTHALLELDARVLKPDEIADKGIDDLISTSAEREKSLRLPGLL